ncbi:MAG: hypothetical protein IJL59_04560 [Clostridia bacterium]|nr:hypothetical protein [Clostridia bacterium]MBQ9189072.1 hypothetical protein [Clostridia bacterium]MBR3271205.1 hypothetical protein [Clostridia bacterium]
MTLLELIHAALDELERAHDDETVVFWRERLTAYANEAISDLFTTFRPWRRESLTPQNGVLHTGDLSLPCSKVLGLESKGLRIPFHYGADTTELIVPGWQGGALTVVYRYAPSVLIEDTDRSTLPAVCDPLIVLYMVARDRAHGDAAAQNGARLRLSLYEAQKRRLKLDYDEPCGCRIYNYC